MRKVADGLAYITAALLTAILIISLITHGKVIGASLPFAILVEVMYLSLVVSSLIIGKSASLNKASRWSHAFYGNIALITILTSLKMVGAITLPSWLLLGIDFYWLILYLYYFRCGHNYGPNTP